MQDFQSKPKTTRGPRNSLTQKSDFIRRCFELSQRIRDPLAENSRSKRNSSKVGLRALPWDQPYSHINESQKKSCANHEVGRDGQGDLAQQQADLLLQEAQLFIPNHQTVVSENDLVGIAAEQAQVHDGDGEKKAVSDAASIDSVSPEKRQRAAIHRDHHGVEKNRRELVKNLLLLHNRRGHSDWEWKPPEPGTEEWRQIKKFAMERGGWAPGSHNRVEQLMLRIREDFFQCRPSARGIATVDTERLLADRHAGHFAIEHGSREANIVLDCLEDGFSLRHIAAWISTDRMRNRRFQILRTLQISILCHSPWRRHCI